MLLLQGQMKCVSEPTYLMYHIKTETDWLKSVNVKQDYDYLELGTYAGLN
jgi:hypothetical protein